MAGQPDQPYDIYDTGIDKALVRGADNPANQAGIFLQSQDPMSLDYASYYDLGAGSANSSGSAVPLSSDASGGGDYNGDLGSTIKTLQPESFATGELTSILYTAKKSFTDTTNGMRQGLDTDGTYKWIMGGSTNSIDWNVTTANVLTIVGSITATTGTIGGFEIGSTYIRDVANSFGLSSASSSGQELVLYSTLFNDANLVSYWRFEGNSNDYKSTNNGTDTAITYSAANGKFTQGAGFNGTTSRTYSQSSSFNISGVSPLTIAMWIKVTTMPVGSGFFDPIMTQEGASDTTYDKGLRLYADGSIAFYAYDGAVKRALSSAGAIVAGTYALVIGTYDGVNLKLYVNGSLVATQACASTYGFTTPRLVFSHTVTADGNSGMYNGALDDVSYFSRALSAAEITSYYSSSDPVRFWAGSTYANRMGAPARITDAGVATFASGTIGSWLLSATTLVGGNTTLDSAGKITLGTGNNIIILDANDTTYRLAIGNATYASAPFRVSKAGAVTATSGTIGGWTLSSTTLTATGIILDSSAQTITVGSGAPQITIDGVNKRVRTSTFSAGLQGWSIESDGSAEFANIRARGEFHTQVLAYGEVHATAGSSLLSKSAGKLKSDVTTLTSPSTFNIDITDPETGHVQVFAVSDILRIKDGSGSDNWLTISSVSDQTTFFRYVCTKSNGTNGTFRAGAAVVDYGASGQGYIYSTVDDTNSPYISVRTHAGSPWSSSTENLRVGNLNGYLDYVTNLYGFAVGSSSGTNANITIDTTNGIRIRNGTTSVITLDNAGNVTVNKITATSGTIAAFTIAASTISATNLTITSGAANTANIAVGTGANLAGLNSGNSGTDIAFWSGDTFANRATAPFRVDLAGNLTATSATINGSTISNQDLFGDGSDGDATISSNTSLTTDMYYNNLTVTSSSVLSTAGFRIFVKGTLTINSGSSIARNGNAGGNGGNGTNGAGSTPGTGGSGGSAAAALVNGSVQGALAGVAGAAGGTGVGHVEDHSDGNGGGNGSAGVNIAKSLASLNGVAGASGGNGGNVTNPNNNTGGTGGGAAAGGTRTGTVFNTVRNVTAAYTLMDYYPEAASTPVLAALHAAPSNGAAGGGGSGAGASNSAGTLEKDASGGGGGGGGGGSNGGIVVLFAKTIVNNSTGGIAAKGGTGGNGGNAGTSDSQNGNGGGVSAAGGSGGGAGGCGGNGGIVIYCYQSLSGAGTISVAGGAGGTGGNKSVANTAGGGSATDGANGATGTTGNVGVSIALQV